MSFSKVQLRRVAPGRCHTLFQTQDGLLLSTGNNEVGQLGIGIESEESRAAPQVIEILRAKPIVDFSVGLDHNVAITRDGKAYSWGFGPDGQLGFESDDNKPAPTEIPGLSAIVAVGCGLDHTVVLDGAPYPPAPPPKLVLCSDSGFILSTAEGAYWSFGRNENGQLGLGTEVQTVSRPTRRDIPGVKLIKVACGGVHSIGLSTEGILYSWGDGASGRLGLGSSESTQTPTPIDYFVSKQLKVVQYSVGGGHTLALTRTLLGVSLVFSY